MDLNLRYPQRGGGSRRDFLLGSLAAGFALAMPPMRAEMIRTDSARLLAGEVRIPVLGGDMVTYQAMPSEGKKFPVVLVVHEVFGVQEYTRDICRRFAKLGYLAVVPELFARQGDPTSLASSAEIMEKIVAFVPDSQVMGDLDATLKYIKASGKGDATRIGITGFGWGGRIAWLYAAHHSKIGAAGVWYGPVAGTTDALHPRNPINVAAELKCPVLGLYGGKDAEIPAASVEEMRAKTKDAGKTAEIVVYPDAGHDFHADNMPGYDKSAAEDGWKRLLGWFRQNDVA